MKIYVDTSVYNRPFDDQTQQRIESETLALHMVLRLVEVEALELVSSPILEYENSRNRSVLQRQWVNGRLQLTKSYQKVNEAIVERAQELEQQGLGAIDAIHVAWCRSGWE